MKALLYSLFFCIWTQVVIGQYETIQSIPNPKTSDNSHVSNPDQLINLSDDLRIEQLLQELEENDGFQVSLVAVESIGTNEPESFAIDLFNHWGLGSVNKHDGLLILFVLDQRAIEFKTGTGTETVLTDYDCFKIQDTYMVPQFKDGDYSSGLLNGVEQVYEQLSGQTVDHVENTTSSTTQHRTSEATTDNSQRNLIIGIIGWHLFGLLLFFIALIIVRLRYDPYKKYAVIRYFHVWIWAILFPITHIVVVIFAKRLKQRYRDMVRFSDRTGEIMRKMSDEDEDQFLSKGQLTEELVKSIDYDVWTTDNHEDILVLSYKPLFSKYTSCPKCKFKTYKKEYDRQTSAPTYYSSGRGERKHSCANCHHEKITRYTIPKLRRSSRTSSGGATWRSSGGGGFSGGGSWGGGSSSGGGAGSRW